MRRIGCVGQVYRANAAVQRIRRIAARIKVTEMPSGLALDREWRE